MSVRVFISSTSEDLKQDCRPKLITAVQEAQCIAVSMESWDTEFQPPIQVCRQKLEQESTHYLGVFAYRRGWVPAELGKSITEAEFDWALEYQKPMVIFVPNAGSEFGAELLRRAANQTPEDAAAQTAFIKRVMRDGTVIAFDDVTMLAVRAVRRATVWAIDGVRAIAAQGQSTPKPAPTDNRRIPSETEILNLGRKRQRTIFRTSLEQIAEAGLPEIACFVLYGASGYGHVECHLALRQEFERLCIDQPRRFTLAIKPGWGQNSIARLLENLGSQIEPGWLPATPQELGSRLATLLNTSDILIEISNVQRIENALRGLITGFWQPLAQALSGAYLHRLVVALTLEQSDIAAAEDLLQSPFDDAAAYNPQCPIVLPKLEAFTQAEIFAWLKSWMPTVAAAQELAQTLFAETQGQPQVLYAKLRAQDTWPE